MKRITIALLCLLMSLAALGQDVSYVLDKDISYSTKKDAYSKKRLKLDVYHPKKGGDCPVLVWFHGGGIEGGNKHIVVAAGSRVSRLGSPEACRILKAERSVYR